jgi:hypothetical protein
MVCQAEHDPMAILYKQQCLALKPPMVPLFQPRHGSWAWRKSDDFQNEQEALISLTAMACEQVGTNSLIV